MDLTPKPPAATWRSLFGCCLPPTATASSPPTPTAATTTTTKADGDGDGELEELRSKAKLLEAELLRVDEEGRIRAAELEDARNALREAEQCRDELREDNASLRGELEELAASAEGSTPPSLAGSTVALTAETDSLPSQDPSPTKGSSPTSAATPSKEGGGGGGGRRSRQDLAMEKHLARMKKRTGTPKGGAAIVGV